MPGFDGTGPMGAGSMTGGGRGICQGNAASGFRGRGRRAGGFGPGRRGQGVGLGRTAVPNDISNLKATAQNLRNSLSSVESRIREFEGSGE